MLPRHRAWRWLLWACAAVFLLGVVRYAGYQLDDTFISLRYARNLVEGQGLVFNPGERVEGYTNLLFVLISAVLIGAGLDPVAGAGVVAFASALAVLAATAALVREVMEAAGADPDASRRAAVTAICLLLTSEGFAYWSVAGMETMLFAALLALAVLQLMRETRRGRGHASSALLVLLSLTRPEGVVAAAVVLGGAMIQARPGRAEGGPEGSRAAAGPDGIGPPAAGPPGWRRLAATAGLTAAGTGALFLWRLWYYGSLLPNTFHAKVTGGPGQTATGWRYLVEWMASSPVAALSLAAPAILLWPAARRRLGRRSPLWILHALVAAFAVSAAALGGDSMPFHRFMIHVLPLAVVVVVVGGERLLGARPRTAGAAAALALAVVAAGTAASRATEQPYRAFVAHRTAVVGARAGKWFGAGLPEGSLMAVNTVGALPWASRLPTLDMLGLTDPVIARRPVYVDSPGWAGHRRGWGAYVLSRRPAAILWYNSAGSPRPFYLGDRELADNPWFRFFYRHRVRQLPAPDVIEGDAAPVIARFPGHAFGFHPSGSMAAPELGLVASFRDGLLPWTEFREGPVTLHWFEPDPRDAGLWSLRSRREMRIDEFVDAVAGIWAGREAGRPPPEPGVEEERRRVEALCEEARVKIGAGDMEGARRILSRAVAANARARVPRVYHYMANLAVMTGEILVAIPAQKEALRLAPGNRLYAENLKRLLKQPWTEATAPRVGKEAVPER